MSSSNASHGAVSGAGGSLGGGTASSARSKQSKSGTVNYLLLYEAMVRHQDSEHDATRDHVALTVERIKRLGRGGGGGGGKPRTGAGNDVGRDGSPPALADEDADADDAVPEGMLTYPEMRRCLLRLGYAWNRTLPPSEGEDDVSVVSATSASSTLVSGGGASAASSSRAAAARDIIATDAQLIMLLTTLVEAEERGRARRLARAEDDDEDDEEEDDEEEKVRAPPSRGLYVPEFVQAYKLIVGGMQSLQGFPHPDESPAALRKACADLGVPEDPAALDALRARSRERTLGLLRLFGPDPRPLDDDDDAGAVWTATRQSPGEGTTPPSGKSRGDGLGKDRRASRIAAATARAGKKGKKAPATTPQDGLLPRLTEEEIRRTVHTKDAALARVLEEHEAEMNCMATGMEELRLKGLRSRQLLRGRRKRARILAVAGAVVLACGGGYYEYGKREEVRREIKEGREAERAADAATVAALKADVKDLEGRLGDAEATIRYEEGRHAKIQQKYDRTKAELEEKNAAWLLDRRDLDRCRADRKDLDAALTAATEQSAEAAEEAGWCRDRLADAERAVEGMERALKKRESGASQIPTLAEIEKEIEAASESGEGNGLVATKQGGGKGEDKSEGKKGKGKSKPVRMEMKYNRSFRNAVYLRQIYSAVAGMAVSALLPGIGRALALLFL
ncbi:hypothetical protein ACHAWF_008715 [Thalassiosira exigua]